MPPSFGPDEIAKMRMMYLQDRLPLSEIAKHMNSSRSTVYRYLKDSGITFRSPGGSARHSREEDNIEAIEYMYWTLNYSTSDIAQSLGIHQTAVLKRMQRHGIARRSRDA